MQMINYCVWVLNYMYIVQVEILARVKFSVLRIEYQILAGRNYSNFWSFFHKLHYIYAGCIVSDTQF